MSHQLAMVYILATIRQIESHDSIMWLQQRRVDSEVSGASRVRLHVDSPALGVKSEQLERPLLTQRLHLVNDLGAAIVPVNQSQASAR